MRTAIQASAAAGFDATRPRRALPFAIAWLLVAAGCSSGTGTKETFPEQAWDVTAHVRLSASATRGMLWPYEARDAIATVRDDDPDTTWKAPLDESSTIGIDLLPWQHRAVPLQRLEARTAGDGTASLVVVLRESCGGRELATIPWQDPSVGLDLGDVEAGCVEVLVAPDGDFQLAGLSLWARAIPDPAPPRPQASKAHPGTGVIEAFYGEPWSWRERKSLLRALASMGMDTYVYAPKRDPYHRERWRDPYPADFESAFADLASLGHDLGVGVVFGLSPFVDLDPGSEADYVLARDKLGRFANRGAGGILLGADDSEFDNARPVDAALGSAHAAFVGRLLADLRVDHPGLPCWFVPTVYSDARADGIVDGESSPRFPDGWGYLGALASLPSDVRILWTGRDTSMARMTAQDLATPAQAMGRAPAIFDNFWANDGGDGFTARLWLAPLQGRSGDVLPAVSGYLHNPLIQGAIARWRIGTFGHWLCGASGDTGCGEAEEFAASVETVLHPARSDREADRALLRFLPQVFDGDGAGRALQDRALESAVDTLIAELREGGAPRAATIATLQSRLAALAGLSSLAHHSGLDADLVDELAFPLEKARTLGIAGLDALALLFQRLAGREDADGKARLDEALSVNALQRFDLCNGTPERLGEAVSGMPAAAVPGVGGALSLADPPSCTAGDSWAWTPVAGADAVAIGGLPGVRIEGDTVRFAPDHAGEYRGVVACLRTGTDGAAQAFGFREFRIACAAGGDEVVR